MIGFIVTVLYRGYYAGMEKMNGMLFSEPYSLLPLLMALQILIFHNFFQS